MTYRIRGATDADREAVVALAARLADFALPPWRTVDEIVGGDVRDLLLWFETSPSSDRETMLVAEAAGQVIGLLHVVTATDFFTKRPHAHVSVLAVASDVEGRGIGSALLQAAEQWARAHGSDRLTLMHFAGNTHAARVYERRGYEPEMVRRVKLL